MYAETGPRRIWVAGHRINVWGAAPGALQLNPSAIRGYVHNEQWESVLNALVLLADSDPKGLT